METITSIENQRYGAVEMINSYRKNLSRGLEIAIIIHVMVVSLYFLVNYFNNLQAGDIKDYRKIIREISLDNIDIPPSAKDEEIPILRTEDLIKPVKDVSALIPEPVAKHLAEELTIKTQDELDKIVANVSKDGDTVKYTFNGNNTNIALNDNVIDRHINNNVTDDVDRNRNYLGSEVEVLPECVNLAQVNSTLIYPRIAVESNIEGKVTVKVLVGTDGKVIKIGSISGQEIFYDEVKKKAMNLEFTPGLQGGNAVKVWIYVPFSFKLQN